jgi:hypothetical protein
MRLHKKYRIWEKGVVISESIANRYRYGTDILPW